MTHRQAPIMAISRNRIHTDGEGVTTLVGFLGCPLRCRWCLNPFSFDPSTKHTLMTPSQLYERLKVDELYFLATGGGVTFGGGEPLLQGDFIKEFRSLCGDEWHLYAETSLAVPYEQVQKAAECIDEFIIDVKDTNPAIYRRYTGQENSLVLENLKGLLTCVPSQKIMVRLPLIPEFNTEEDRQKSHALLCAMGVTRFDFFPYRRR